MVTLKDVNKDNWRDCIALSLRKDQEENVASNLATIAESKFEKHYILKAVYKDNLVVGFVAYCRDDEPEIQNLYWIFRFMISEQFQNKGYGSKAIELVLEEIRSSGCNTIRTMHKPKNTIAANIYNKFGFKDIGVLDDGDILLELDI